MAFSKDAAWFKECFPGNELPDFTLITAKVDCLVTRSGDTIYIRGELSASIRQECGRCLEVATTSHWRRFCLYAGSG